MENLSSDDWQHALKELQSREQDLQQQVKQSQLQEQELQEQLHRLNDVPSLQPFQLSELQQRLLMKQDLEPQLKDVQQLQEMQRKEFLQVQQQLRNLQQHTAQSSEHALSTSNQGTSGTVNPPASVALKTIRGLGQQTLATRPTESGQSTSMAVQKQNARTGVER